MPASTRSAVLLLPDPRSRSRCGEHVMKRTHLRLVVRPVQSSLGQVDRTRVTGHPYHRSSTPAARGTASQTIIDRRCGTLMLQRLVRFQFASSTARSGWQRYRRGTIEFGGGTRPARAVLVLIRDHRMRPWTRGGGPRHQDRIGPAQGATCEPGNHGRVHEARTPPARCRSRREGYLPSPVASTRELVILMAVSRPTALPQTQ